MFKSKLPNLGTTIFTTMSALAAEHGALNLSQGFPNFAADPELLRLLGEYSTHGFNQYAPMTGVRELREQLSLKTKKLYGAHYDSETEVTISSGATEAIFAAIAATVSAGDEVIVFEPAYDSYLPAIDLCGGIPVYITLHYPDFQIDWDLVKSKISPKTKMIIVNTPHNPTGSVFSENDINELAKIVADRDIYLVGDEVYEHIIFDGLSHQSLCTNSALKEKSFICGSFGKTFHITGWKIGYCFAPKELSVEFRKIHQYLTFSTFTPAQYALAKYLENENNYLSIPSFYQRKRDVFLESIAGSRFEFIPSKGSFFQNVSYANITDANDAEYAIQLTKTIGVASIPTSVFYHQKLDQKVLRFCFAKDDETLQKAGEILSKL
ncbi:methionine aminotransferase [Lacihabitans soyangensis]|uniref:Aminotransferase class I/II-fold pyridoxal phosphate-dependent enzyme n=1 Tax=Lacihabitans soyangensis TaxID=869394 RepID=A0AAE3H5V6_9BACT|nr:methionine aminotransferase [Lacihabitans soyangensis]MCP9765452.1 aminotransferase class I/II-fold pyridoxal phosphate-dependent enzyme [Lacihabitans soyangensis]